jgi:hypothetical protein
MISGIVTNGNLWSRVSGKYSFQEKENVAQVCNLRLPGRKIMWCHPDICHTTPATGYKPAPRFLFGRVSADTRN